MPGALVVDACFVPFMSFTPQKSEEETKILQEENESTKHVLAMLRQKLHITTEHEIENQRRLMVRYL